MKDKEPKKSKRPESVQLNITCPHCEESVIVIITKAQVNLFRKGFRTRLAKATKLWSTIRVKVGKGKTKRARRE